MENMEKSCVFCSIVAKDVPSEVVYQDEQVVAIKDANPQAPIHVLLIPREHNLESLNDASKLDLSLLGHLLYTTANVSNQIEIDETGYRVVINTEDSTRHTNTHLRFHVVGGR